MQSNRETRKGRELTGNRIFDCYTGSLVPKVDSEQLSSRSYRAKICALKFLQTRANKGEYYIPTGMSELSSIVDEWVS